MGGADDRGRRATTTDVLIEAAHFDPVTIARSARRHKLPSEASQALRARRRPGARRRRGRSSPSTCSSSTAGEWPTPSVTDVGTAGRAGPGDACDVDSPVEDRRHRLPRRARSSSTLQAIGCDVVDPATATTAHGDRRRPGAPTSPTAADLVEEVARIDGYDRIPSIMPDAARRAPASPTPSGCGALVADVLAGQGLSEVLSAPFVGADRYDRARPRRRRRGGAHRAAGQPAVRRAAADAHPAARHPGRRAAPQRRPRHARRRHLRARPGRRARRTAAARRRPRTSASGRPTRRSPPIRAAVPPQPRHLGRAGLAGDRGAGRLVGRRPPRRRSPTSSTVARTVGEALGLALEVSADAVAPFHPGRCARVDAGRRHPRRPRRRAAPQGRRGARPAGPHRGRRARPRRAHRGLRGDRAGPHPVTPSRWPRATSPSSSTSRCRPDAVQRALRDGAGEHLEALTLFDVYRGDQVGDGQQVPGLPAHLPGARPHADHRRGERPARHRAAGGGRGRRGGAARHERAHRGARRRRGRGRAGAGVRGRPRWPPRRRRHRVPRAASGGSSPTPSRTPGTPSSAGRAPSRRSPTGRR